jgi:acyl-CoA reductase-like NAD-dependent aldehyde dehydrogenase
LAWNSSRLFVLEKFEVEWSEKIQNYLQNLKPSESIEDLSVWTPCLKAKSFAKFEEIKAQAFEDKGKLLQSTKDLSQNLSNRYLAPVFTKDMSRCSTLQQDQIHSPFFILSAVKYPFDVAKYSNVSYFGFASHLYGDAEKLKKVGDTLEVGAIFTNKFSANSTRLWSGLKQSGYGLQDDRALGSFFSNSKNWR